MPIPPVPSAVATSAHVERRQLAEELAATAVDLRDPDAAEAVADVVAVVHALLVEAPAATS